MNAITVRIPDALYDKLFKAAKRKNESISDFVREAISHAVEKPCSRCLGTGIER